MRAAAQRAPRTQDRNDSSELAGRAASNAVRRAFHHARWISLALAALVVGCGGGEVGVGGGFDGGGADGGAGGDAGLLDGQGDTRDVQPDDATVPVDTVPGDGGGGGGVCGDGTCDPLESAATCPLDCKDAPQSPIECLQSACAGAVTTCSLDAACAVTLGCIAGCANAPCVGECREKAYAKGPPSPATKGLFDCASGSKCLKAAVCGDGACEPGEVDSCPKDCGGPGPVCGNFLCEQGESAATCPKDCGSVKPVCGNGMCEQGEDGFACPVDCGDLPTCGDGICSKGEADTCPKDCSGPGPICGDGVCSKGEMETCPKDCVTPGPVCGDGICVSPEPQTCPKDCQPSTCGNGTCDASESPSSCPADCAKAVCGDGICAASESPGSCPKDCGSDPLSCAKQACPKQFETCASDPPCAKLLACFAGCGTDGSCAEKCMDNIGADALASFLPLQQCASKSCGSSAICGDGVCEDKETPTTCAKDCKFGPVCGNGMCELGESFMSCPADCKPPTLCGNAKCEPGESTKTCPQDCGAPSKCGNGVCDAGESMATCPQDCVNPGELLVCLKGKCTDAYVKCSNDKACGQVLNCSAACSNAKCLEECASKYPESMKFLEPLGLCGYQAGCLGGSQPVCGDGQCSDGEWQSCPQDCGPPPPVCGNGQCEPGETAQSCPGDCSTAPGSCVGKCGGQGSNGQCWCDDQCSGLGDCCGDFAKACPTMVPVCGDGKCNGKEDAQTCPKDCPVGPSCGNKSCEPGESPESCPADCGPPSVCGDGVCMFPFESPDNCPGDCAPQPVCGNGKCEGDEKKTCAKDCQPVKPCAKKSDCAATEVCCNSAAGQVCVPAGQCF